MFYNLFAGVVPKAARAPRLLRGAGLSKGTARTGEDSGPRGWGERVGGDDASVGRLGLGCGVFWDPTRGGWVKAFGTWVRRFFGTWDLRKDADDLLSMVIRLFCRFLGGRPVFCGSPIFRREGSQFCGKLPLRRRIGHLKGFEWVSQKC